MQTAQDVAQQLAEPDRRLGPTAWYSTATTTGLLVPARPEVTNYTVFDVSDRLRERGRLVPAYTFPKNRRGSAGIASSCGPA